MSARLTLSYLCLFFVYSENTKRIGYLQSAKEKYLFNSDHIERLLTVTESVKTRLAFIEAIAPRLTDPNAKMIQFIDAFRYEEEKDRVKMALTARAEQMKTASMQTQSPIGGGVLGGGRGRGRGRGRGGGGRGGGTSGSTANSSATTPVKTEVSTPVAAISTPGESTSNVPKFSLGGLDDVTNDDEGADSFKDMPAEAISSKSSKSSKSAKRRVSFTNDSGPVIKEDERERRASMNKEEAESDKKNRGEISVVLATLNMSDSELSETQESMEAWESCVLDNIEGDSGNAKNVSVVDTNKVSNSIANRAAMIANSGKESYSTPVPKRRGSSVRDIFSPTRVTNSPEIPGTTPGPVSYVVETSGRSDADEVQLDTPNMRKASRISFTLGISRSEFLGLNEEAASLLDGDDTPRYTYKELLRRIFHKDYGEMDPSNVEIYLLDSEFDTYFKMDRDAFKDLPKWKQTSLKKSLMLF
jgi:hypothetical protein